MTKTETKWIENRGAAGYDSIPADVRWSHIRDGLAHSLTMAQYTLRTGAERRGAAYVVRGQASDLDACSWALLGRP